MHKKKIILTGKSGNRFFYKGRGSGSRGFWSKGGKYRIQKWKIYQFIVPDLTDCKLKPYVSSRTPIVKVDGTYSDDLVHLTKTKIEFGVETGKREVEAKT